MVASILLGASLLAGPRQVPDAQAIYRNVRPAVVIVRTSKGQGSGFAVGDGSLIVTNYHVVKNAGKSLQVGLNNWQSATVLTHSAAADLAILSVRYPIPHALKLWRDLPEVGSPVYVVGSPMGLHGTLTTGIVSALRADAGVTYIQTSAPISSGSSGSPVVDADGDVVGIATFYFKQGQNLNFAVAAYHADNLVASLSRVDLTGGARTGTADGAADYWEVPRPTPLPQLQAVSGSVHNLGLTRGGRVVAWGQEFLTTGAGTVISTGACTPPAGLSGVVQVAAGYHSLALKSDGTVVAWGHNDSGQSTVPAGLSGVVQVAAGSWHSLALKSDGTVVAWGQNSDGQSTVPAGLSGVVQVAAGFWHSLALKSDGTVVAWGHNEYGACDVPAGLTGVVQVAAGFWYSLALKSDGTVVAWGHNSLDRLKVPAGLSGVVQVSTDAYYSLALKSDGTVVAWGSGGAVPAGLSGVVQVVSCGGAGLALKSDGTVVEWSPYTESRPWEIPTAWLEGR